MSGVADEEWKQHYDALINIRVLNKFHFSELNEHMIANDGGKWAGAFISS